MRPEDYPPQEPASDVGRRYEEAVRRLGDGVVPTHEAIWGGDPYQSVALHVPAKPTGAILAFIHGGGWTNGYKEWMAFMAPALGKRGIGLASIGYRLAPGHVFPAGYDDARRGLAWVCGNAGRFGLDPRRLFVGGHSAGGHYAALMAVTTDWQDAVGIPVDAVAGCLPISGVYCFTEESGLSMRPRFLGPEKTERAASPIHNIGRTPPPFFLAHGDKDFPHLMRQAESFEAALKAAGGEVTRVVMPERDHFTASYAAGEPDGPWVGPAAAWMDAMARRRIG